MGKENIGSLIRTATRKLKIAEGELRIAKEKVELLERLKKPVEELVRAATSVNEILSNSEASYPQFAGYLLLLKDMIREEMEF